MEYSHVRVDAEKLFTEDLAGLFNVDLVQSIIRESKVESFDNIYLAILQGHSFKVVEELTPRVFAICQEVKQKLDFTEDVEFFIDSSPSFNAYALSRIEDDQPHIITLNAGLVDKFNADELRFIVGHEFGHLISRNSELRRTVGFVYPPGTKMSSFLEDKLETWEKLSELTADRFGYLAVGDMSVARSVFFKLSSGLDCAKVEFNGEAYQRAMDEILEYFKTTTGALATTHPVNPIRLKALEHFAGSEIYAAISKGEEPAEDKALAEKMQELAALILNKGLSPLAWQRKRFLASAGLLVANADGRVTEEEMKTVLEALSSATHFPRQLLDEILSEGDVGKVFVEAVSAILEANPSERHSLFFFMLTMAMTDQSLTAEEADFLFQTGENVFGFQRKEVAQMMAEVLQKQFVPNLLG
jgi:Zn-dependent protease with chaperone function/uncharacterized tellurite resistance protein B-like protein